MGRKSLLKARHFRMLRLNSLVLLLLTDLQQLHRVAAAIQTERDSQDGPWVLSRKSVSRMVPLLQQAEAATRLQGIVTGAGGLVYDNRPKTILLRHRPIPLRLQRLLLHAAREAFAAEERLLPGALDSYYRTLLFVVHAASTMKEEPHDVLRFALYRAGLATGVVGSGEAMLNRVPPAFPSSGQRVLKNRFYEALASAEAFVRDVQHALSATGSEATTPALGRGEMAGLFYA